MDSDTSKKDKLVASVYGQPTTSNQMNVDAESTENFDESPKITGHFESDDVSISKISMKTFMNNIYLIILIIWIFLSLGFWF